jgi:fermentation-respiration switch protein FrsA (DUF1100 family)
MLSVLTLVLIGLPVGFFLLRRFERAVTFHPERHPMSGAWRLPARAEDAWFNVADGTRLHGWFVRATTQPATATVIYFHGNGGNLSYLDWLAGGLTGRGFDLLLFDYRGYGQSEGNVSDERGIYADADAAYDYVVRERGVAPAKLVLYGQSLGTSAATDVAARRECAALVLESGMSSASDMAALILPWLPRGTHRFAVNRFDNVGKLARISRPVLVAHGDRDEVIPVAQGHALYAAAREPKKLIIVPGAGHNNLVGAGGEKYLDEVAAFVQDALDR